MRIALCDDSRQYLSVLESYADRITQVKIECDVFESGEELVKMFERHGSLYDAVFLDMEMGGMNGLDTANMIRSKDRYAVIFFVTSHKKYMQESFASCSSPCRLKNFRTPSVWRANGWMRRERLLFSLKTELRSGCSARIFCILKALAT